MNTILRTLACAMTTMGMLLVGGCASRPAEPDNAELLKRFQRADRNGDGKVSRIEFTDLMIADAFALYDKDRDGFVSEAEFTAGGGTAETFRAVDRAGQGKVTLEQVKASKRVRDQMAMPFDEADTSGTGYVTFEQFIAYLQRVAPYVR